jgi:hypothetical protein
MDEMQKWKVMKTVTTENKSQSRRGRPGEQALDRSVGGLAGTGRFVGFPDQKNRAAL